MSDELNELSKKTLGSYIRKSANELHSKGIEQGINQKSAGIVDASKKLTKEDIEMELNELSKKTLGSYIKKSSKSAEKAWDKTDKEEDKAMSTDGEKYPEKQARHNAAAAGHIKTWQKRDVGITTAKKKMQEEVTEEQLAWIAENISEEDYEQLDELSKKTLGSYIKHSARDTQGREKYKGELDTAKTAISNATNTLDNSSRHGNDPTSRNNFRNAAYTAKSSIDHEMSKNYDKMINRSIGRNLALKKLTKEEMEELIDLVETKNIVDFQPTLIEILNRKSMVLIESMRDPEEELEDEFDFEDNDSEEEVTEEELEWIAENISEEDYDQLDELSKKTLGSYIKKATPQLHGAKNELRNASDYMENDIKRSIKNKTSGILRAADKLTKEEMELEEGSKAMGYHPAEEDEWGSERKGRKDPKFSFKTARKAKEAMREELAPKDPTNEA